MTVAERRKFSRIPFNVKVKYDVLKGSPYKTGEARSKNVSAGGICLAIPEKIDIGALLRLKLYIRNDEDFITVIGRVVWFEEFSISHKSDDKAYDCGIEFISIDPQDQKKLVTT